MRHFLLLFGLLVLTNHVCAQAQERPNIILMLSDDQGWSGTSVAMHPTIDASKGSIFHTPNLERMAMLGMRFSNAYSPAPVCSPTRISLQTGKSPAQLHWTKAAPAETGQMLIEPRLIKSIPENEITIGELLQKAGYATAHYGKWHISGGGPAKHGYDEHDGDTGNEQAFKFVDPNPVDIFGMAQRAEDFMQANSQKGKPFYIQLSWNALHASENANRATLAKYQTKLSGQNEKRISTAAITEDLDTGVGRVLDAVERLGLSKNTYVIYMSDNGAGGGGGGGAGGNPQDADNRSNAKRGLRGGKGGVWEGGIRVPFIITGPNVAPNSWSHTPIVGYDLFPTFCHWAGIPSGQLPKGIEGGSIAEIVSNNGQGTMQRSRNGLYFHFPHYQSEGGPQSSIRFENWKLIYFYETRRAELFNLETDFSERNNLATQYPQQAIAMQSQLETYLKEIQAQFPTPNPDYDPNSPTPTRKERGRNPKEQPQNNKKKNNS
jgi:arylsulfatase A-like enzyme